MPFPEGWPPRPATNRRSVRVYIEGTTTPNFHDNAYLFSLITGAVTVQPTIYVPTGERGQTPLGTFQHTASPLGGGRNPNDAVRQFQNIAPPVGGQAPPVAMAWTGTLKVLNLGGAGEDLAFTFDGLNTQGLVLGEAIPSPHYYRNRFEAGIGLRIYGTAAVGSITTIDVADLNDGETFVLNDGGGTGSVTFEFDDDASVVETTNLRQVDISSITTADEVRDAIIAAINSAPALGITASDGGAATVDLLGGTGTLANVAITETVLNVGFSVSGMTGGLGTAVDFVVEGW